MYYFCVILIVFVRESKSFQDWDHSHVHCRDNLNHPVDWWYIYKPPIEKPILLNSNFTYILPKTNGRWQMADPDQDISTDYTMLHSTLDPLYRPNLKDHISYLISYGKTEYTQMGGSSAYGIMVANEVGGYFIAHSIPGFPKLNGNHAKFPDEELPYGHFLMCLSLDLPTLNLLASLLKEAGPQVTMHVPYKLRVKLPFWHNFNIRSVRDITTLNTRAIDLETLAKTLQVHVMVRRPRENICLYSQFAKKKQIILDVYGHDRSLMPFCYQDHGIRYINSISLKIPDNVFYIRSSADKMGFAVSTAAAWQKKASGHKQYWACVSNVENEERTGKGGFIICVEDYSVWWTFDNLKIKEPTCCVRVLFLV